MPAKPTTDTETDPGHWLRVFVDQHGDGSSDYNDSDAVQGYLTVIIAWDEDHHQGTLTVKYEPDPEDPLHPETTERYLVFCDPLDDSPTKGI